MGGGKRATVVCVFEGVSHLLILFSLTPLSHRSSVSKSSGQKQPQTESSESMGQNKPLLLGSCMTQVFCDTKQTIQS